MCRTTTGGYDEEIVDEPTLGLMTEEPLRRIPPAANGPPALVVDQLTKRFGERTAFSEVSFEVAYGEVFGFLGPNGAGKTTTVRTLGTLIAPTSGSATVAGIPLNPGERGGDPPAHLDHARSARASICA